MLQRTLVGLVVYPIAWFEAACVAFGKGRQDWLIRQLRRSLRLSEAIGKALNDPAIEHQADRTRYLILYLQRAPWETVEAVVTCSYPSGWVDGHVDMIWSWVYLYWANCRFTEARSVIQYLIRVQTETIRAQLADTQQVLQLRSEMREARGGGTKRYNRAGDAVQGYWMRLAWLAAGILEWCERLGDRELCRRIRELGMDERPRLPVLWVLDEAVAKRLGIPRRDLASIRARADAQCEEFIQADGHPSQ